MSTAPILIVDDDEVLSRVLRRVLMRDGHEVAEAGGVAQALDAARDHKPRLAVLDLCLPDGDGVDLAQKLRAQGHDFPLILMTAYPLRLRDHPELGSSFASVLIKPLNVEDLRRAVNAALTGTAAPTEPAPAEAAAAALPAPRTPAPAPEAGPVRVRSPWPWVAVAGVAVVGVALALPALGVPGIPNPFKSSSPPAATAEAAPPGAPRRTDADTLLVSSDTIDRLHVTTAPVETADRPRPLVMSGTLNLDPNYLSRVHPLFPGEVVEVAMVEEPGPSGPQKRPLGFGDPVKGGELLAVVWSKDLGEKKSELIDALSQLWLDQETLQKLDELYKDLATSEANLRLARKAVASDRNAVDKAERTLRVWRVPEEDIQVVKDEAKRIYDSKGARDPRKESDWARVEVRARFDGIVVEKNVARGDIVDPSADLYKIADLRRMAAWVHAYEEYVPTLQALPRPIPWRVEAGGRPLDSHYAEEIGPVIDPNQHTALVIGRVDNADGRLRVGQFVTATIDLPPPDGLTAVPAGAVVEDGVSSVVFVKAAEQPDPKATAFVRRRVAVVERLPDVLLVRASGLTPAERRDGVRELRPGEVVATSCVVELKSELESQQAPENAGERGASAP